MHIKRFEGQDMREVVRLVRDELGPDALVLSTRTVPKGRGVFGGFGRSVVEVTAAVDREARPPADNQEPSRRKESERATPDPSWNELRLTQALIHPLEAEIRELRGAMERISREQDPVAIRDLHDEVAALRRVALDIGASQRTQGQSMGSGDASLVRAGLAQRHRESLENAVPENRVDLLARLLDEALSPPRPERDTITLYVGPSGVGKTTTLAKIASRTEYDRSDLALVSTDVHRIAGDSPLKNWAASKDITFEAASSAASITAGVARLGRRPILIDTAGCNRGDGDGIEDLRLLRESLGDRARVCLVLPATRKESDLRGEVERFGALEPDALAVTRVDESGDLGNVANLLLDGTCPPLHWITTGQRVPDDLDVADPYDLAKRILGAAA